MSDVTHLSIKMDGNDEFRFVYIYACSTALPYNIIIVIDAPELHSLQTQEL